MADESDCPYNVLQRAWASTRGALLKATPESCWDIRHDD